MQQPASSELHPPCHSTPLRPSCTAGYEYDILGSWRAGDPSLPEQIAIEIHYRHLFLGTASYAKPADFSNLYWCEREPMHGIGLPTEPAALHRLQLQLCGQHKCQCQHRSELPACPPPAPALPPRLRRSLHDLSLAELSVFLGHMAALGYGIAGREDNPGCSHCSELTFVRVPGA